MGGAGTYSLLIVGEDGTSVQFGASELVLECESECNDYEYLIFESNCDEIEAINCCSLPIFPEFFSLEWTVTYYNDCDEVVGSDSGTIQVYQTEEDPCIKIFTGDTTYTPPGSDPIEIFCDCINV